MSFNPNHMLNNPTALLNPALSRVRESEEKAPVPPPPFDPQIYVNAFSRLGMLNIANVADLGCGAGNFVSVMTQRNQQPEMYLGVDNNHQQISTAKAAYPGWKFIYGDFNDPRIRAELDRYGAFLMVELVDTLDDDLEFLRSMPPGKPLVFSVPNFEREGSKFFLPENRDVHDRYSPILHLHSIGRFRNALRESWSMILASRW